METIDKIRQAEQHASEQLRKAQEDSARLIEEKKMDAAARLKAASKRLNGEASERLKQAGEKIRIAEADMEKENNLAADTLRQNASGKMDKAVEAILGGMAGK